LSISNSRVIDDDDDFSERISSLFVPGSSQCVAVPVSVESSVTEAQLLITADTDDVTANISDVTPYRFQRGGTVSIRHDNQFTFIETDKPIYKPSDTGVYRPQFYINIKCTLSDSGLNAGSSLGIINEKFVMILIIFVFVFI